MNHMPAAPLRIVWSIAIALCLFSASRAPAQDVQQAPISAPQLSQNIAAQLAKGNIQGALVVANTLIKRYPDSKEAVAAKSQALELQTKLIAARAVAAQKAEAAHAASSQADKAEFKRLSAAMKRQDDPVNHDTFLTHRAFNSSNALETYVELYIGQDNSGAVWLRTRLQYGGPDWIFFTKVKFSVDGTTISDKDLGFFNVEHDNGAGHVWEWVDMTVDESALPLFDSLAAGKQVIVRFDGKYRKDLLLSPTSKSALRDTLRLYRLMQQGVHS